MLLSLLFLLHETLSVDFVYHHLLCITTALRDPYDASEDS